MPWETFFKKSEKNEIQFIAPNISHHIFHYISALSCFLWPCESLCSRQSLTEFRAKKGQCFPSWRWSWLGLLDNQEESEEKNGSELGYSTWLLLNEDYPLPPSYHHGFFFQCLLCLKEYLAQEVIVKFCYFLRLFKQFLHN